jgi:hypothetical protein
MVGARLELDDSLAVPDLTIVELPDSDELIIHSPYLQPSRDRFPAPLATLVPWIRTNLAEAAALRARGLQPAKPAVAAGSKDFMLGFGAELYRRVAPQAFKQALQKLRETRGGVRSLQIVSSNPLVPWELMRPVDANPNADFLGVELAVGRFHVSSAVEQYARPPQRLSLNERVVIAPTYTKDLVLAFQETEVREIRRLPRTALIEGSLPKVRQLLETPPRGIIHFVGHGLARGDQSSFRSAIRLTDVDLDLMRWRGLASRLGATRPLVFFNACEVGDARQVANFVEGWAPAMLDAGASGYIGGLWPLGDRGAAQFGAEFHKRLEAALRNGPVRVADVLRAVRALFHENGDPTFLGYVFYGDPALSFAMN